MCDEYCDARMKADRSPVTDADEEAEKLILAELKVAFAGVPVVQKPVDRDSLKRALLSGPEPAAGESPVFRSRAVTCAVMLANA